MLKGVKKMSKLSDIRATVSLRVIMEDITKIAIAMKTKCDLTNYANEITLLLNKMIDTIENTD